MTNEERIDKLEDQLQLMRQLLHITATRSIQLAECLRLFGLAVPDPQDRIDALRRMKDDATKAEIDSILTAHPAYMREVSFDALSDAIERRNEEGQ